MCQKISSITSDHALVTLMDIIMALRGLLLSQGVMYYVQEYMDSGDLYHALDDDELSERLSWYNRCACALRLGVMQQHKERLRAQLQTSAKD